MRSALKDFELNYDKLSNLIDANSIDTGDRYSDLTPKQVLGRVKNGVDKLFKKSVVQEPEYLSANQVEKLINGMWNAVHSGELQDGIKAREFIKLLGVIDQPHISLVKEGYFGIGTFMSYVLY